MPLALPPPSVVQVVSFTLETTGRVYRVRDARLEEFPVGDCPYERLDSELADDAAQVAVAMAVPGRAVIEVRGLPCADGAVEACAVLVNRYS